jgi:hypothetical protein
MSFHSTSLLKDILRAGGKAPGILNFGSMQMSGQLHASAALSLDRRMGGP